MAQLVDIPPHEEQLLDIHPMKNSWYPTSWKTVDIPPHEEQLVDIPPHE